MDPHVRKILEVIRTHAEKMCQFRDAASFQGRCIDIINVIERLLTPEMQKSDDATMVLRNWLNRIYAKPEWSAKWVFMLKAEDIVPRVRTAMEALHMGAMGRNEQSVRDVSYELCEHLRDILDLTLKPPITPGVRESFIKRILGRK